MSNSKKVEHYHTVLASIYQRYRNEDAPFSGDIAKLWWLIWELEEQEDGAYYGY